MSLQSPLQSALWHLLFLRLKPCVPIDRGIFVQKHCHVDTSSVILSLRMNFWPKIKPSTVFFPQLLFFFRGLLSQPNPLSRVSARFKAISRQWWLFLSLFGLSQNTYFCEVGLYLLDKLSKIQTSQMLTYELVHFWNFAMYNLSPNSTHYLLQSLKGFYLQS